MARILFLNERAVYRPGVAELMGYLKSKGHVCEIYFEELEEDILELILDFKPDIVGFSCVSGEQKWAFKKARKIKSHIDALSVFGGPHPTFFPEIIKEEGVDIVCRGEGEYPLLQLADKIDKNEDVSDIKNLWVKKSTGSIIKNEIGYLPNLENLPMPDFDAFYKYKKLASAPEKLFLVSRGCPYNCMNCLNSAKTALATGKGKFVRYKPIDTVIEEILHVKRKYAIDIVVFDENIAFSTKYLMSFLPEYKKHIGLPFLCKILPNRVNEEIIRTLKENNCFQILIGIETGNELFRNKISNKNISNKHIINAAMLIKKKNILLTTENMIGLPDETIDDAIETIKLNTNIQADTMHVSLFQPYPGTQLSEYSIAKGYLKKEDINRIHDDDIYKGLSVLQSPNIKELCNLYRFFKVCVRFNFLIPLVRLLIKLPPNGLFKGILKVSNLFESLKNNKLMPGRLNN
jgi:radical SAM superfamily enzyme YgiQ (UPF0313 family)